MKRSGPPKRRTPLKRTPLKRTQSVPRYRPNKSRTVPLQTVWELKERAKDRCERCHKARKCQVHHRLLRSQGGGHELSNLALLCTLCHDWAHGHSKEAAKAGWIIQLHKVDLEPRLEQRKCGVHGASTASGRCAECDAEQANERA